MVNHLMNCTPSSHGKGLCTATLFSHSLDTTLYITESKIYSTFLPTQSFLPKLPPDDWEHMLSFHIYLDYFPQMSPDPGRIGEVVLKIWSSWFQWRSQSTDDWVKICLYSEFWIAIYFLLLYFFLCLKCPGNEALLQTPRGTESRKVEE